MKTTVKRGLADFGLLILRLALGLDMAYHGAQKLFGEPVGDWFTKNLDTKQDAVAPQIQPTLEARIGGFAKYLGEGFGPDQPGLGLPYPEINAWVAACTEFGAGILVAIGLLTRFGALGLAIAMGVASFLAHPYAWDQRSGGMELTAMLMCMALALVFTGPGRISFDALFFSRKTVDDD